jgi:YaiO family outer membrane protein
MVETLFIYWLTLIYRMLTVCFNDTEQFVPDNSYVKHPVVLFLLVVLCGITVPSMSFADGRNYNNCPEPKSDYVSQFTQGYEHLSNDRTAWGSSKVRLTRQYRNNQQMSLYTARISRFDRRGFNLGFDSYFSLGSNQGYLQVEHSPSATILPEFSLTGKFYYALRQYLRPIFGVSVRDYPSNHLSIGTVGLEYYFGSYRLAYSHNRSFNDDSFSTRSHTFQFGIYESDGSRLSLTYAIGEEVDFIRAGVTSRSDISSLVLSGLYPIECDWGILFELGHHQQGTYYNRNGGHLGVQYSF